MKLVNEVLPEVAKAVYKGIIISYADVTTKYANQVKCAPSLIVKINHNQHVNYPSNMPLQYEELKTFLISVLKGEIAPTQTSLGEVINKDLIKKVEKQIGELITQDNFSELMMEGTDSILLVINSAVDDMYQEQFVNQFIDCKTRFKRMRNRSVRFYALDLNTNLGVVNM